LKTAQQRANWDATGARLPGAGGGRAGRRTADSRASRSSKDAAGIVAGLVAGGATAAFQVESKATHTWDAIGKLTGSDPAQSAEVILLTGAPRSPRRPRQRPPTRSSTARTTTRPDRLPCWSCAKRIAKGPRPKRTVIFAWFGSEESDGRGRGVIFLAHPPVPLTRIIANLEFEMIANSRSARRAAHALADRL